MPAQNHDVCCIGNAIVDVIAEADDAFIKQHGLAKGGMTLIDADRAVTLTDATGVSKQTSGGSAANTAAGIASLGGSAAFIGKIRDDALGGAFASDIRDIGVQFDTAPTTDGAATARCLIFVTPDADRTMQTYLGACVELEPADIDRETVANAAVTYLEGYLFDPPQAKAAFVRAAEIAHANGRQTALSLSDPFCVERHREAFAHLVEHHIDILFANEDEVRALYQLDRFDDALQVVRGKCEIAALTRGEKGSVVATKDTIHVIDAAPADRVLDTTGAGDLFAAGFLYGYTLGRSPATSARLGGAAASEAISHFGARPETDLSRIVAAQL
ncbi:MAG: adenosine kinase [Pseudomonadota bacterium]